MSDRAAVRLIAIDLDGTLLTDDKLVTPRTEAALRAVTAQGRTICLVTGRMLGSTAGYAAQAGLDSPVAVLNGSLITRDTEAPIFDGAIDPAHLEESLTLTDPEIALYWFTRRELLTEPAGESQLDYMKTWNNGHDTICVPELAEHLQAPVYQIHRVGSRERLTALAAHYSGRTDLICELFPSNRGPLCHLELRLAGTNKGAGLRRLAAHHDVSLDQTLAIGDWINDLPLLETAGHAVAMGNAWSQVKAAADEVLERTNNQEGVAHYLERTFL